MSDYYTITAKNTISSFAARLQARKPSPGAGAVAALVGVLGASLAIKVVNFTLGKEKYRRYEKRLRRALKGAASLKKDLSALIEKDALAYEAYSKTKAREALRRATLCAEDISKLSKRGFRLCKSLAPISNVNLKGDLDAAAALFGCASEIAANLARLNKRL